MTVADHSNNAIIVGENLESLSMSTLRHATATPKTATAIDRPVASDEIESLGEPIATAAKLAGFEGKVGETLVLHGQEGPTVEVLVGLGERASVDPDTLRRAAAAYVRAVASHKHVAITMADQLGDEGSFDGLAPVVEGAGLATYRYVALKSDDSGTLDRVTVVAGGRGAKAAFGIGLATVEAVRMVRDLVNEPGGTMVPEAFVAKAKEVAAATGLKATIWDEKRIRKEKMGGILAVNQGSTHPPRFLMLSYTPTTSPTANLALVGKGITFDSGGLSIKSGTGMMTMKVDMAGGAAVVGAMSLLGVYGCTAAVTAYVPLTDNMINGDAFRPGDVFRARNTKTVEVLNTDAEGRLVLADALSYAAEAKPDAIIDIATLTGSVSAALGMGYAGIMATDDAIAERLAAASASTGEKTWRLPLPEEYRTQLDSTVADLKNIGAGPYGGALVAGLFLKEFVADIPWAHIDLGMAAMTETDEGVITKGATGFGVRLLAETVSNW